MTTPIGRTGLARVTTPSNSSPGIALPSTGKVAFVDDFLGDVLADQWNTVEGTDSATSDAAILAGGIGGVCRITTGDAGTGLAADLIGLTQALQWQASNGGLVAETRVKLGATALAYMFFGFTDVVTLEAPVISAGAANTLTSNATDAVGFMYDTNMATDNVWLVGVKNDVDATAQDSAFVPTAAQYVTFRVEVDAAGVATFFINGAQVGTAMSAAITAATDLTPCLYFGKLSGAASITMDVDYVAVQMNRGAAGAAV